MQEKLSQILEEAKKQLSEVSSVQDAEEIRIKVLGKKGQLTEILRSMGGLAPEERKELGMAANKVRADIEGLLDETFSQLKEKAKEAKFKAEKIDVTEPGKPFHIGTKHPLTITIEEISRVFKSMGFSLAEGPEVETVFNNFDALNAGPNHPARDWTEYLEQKLQAALSHVSGVGRAEVILTVKSDGRALVEKDTARQEEKTNETDGQGERSFVQSSESTVYEKDASGKEIPFVSETVLPEICGVLVLAEGGGDGGIQAEITEAAMALFDLDAHKIKVMKLE